MQGMGWGHMPRYLIDGDLHNGKVLSITGRYFKGGALEIVAARRRHAPHGPVANRLWEFIAAQSHRLRSRRGALE